MSSGGSMSKILRSGKKLITNVETTDEKVKTKVNLEMNSTISKKDDSKKSTTKTSARKLKILAEIEAHNQLAKIEEEKEKIEIQRLERMQRKIMLELELKNAVISEESKSDEEIFVDELNSQMNHDRVQTWIDNISHENFENETREDKQMAVEGKSIPMAEYKEKPIELEEIIFTKPKTAEIEDKQEKLRVPTEKHYLEKIVTRQSLNKDLPYFAGNPLEWQNFITQFHETTELCQFSNRENMSRLQKCLKGKARDTVYALLNFPDKLKDVLLLLERRFGRKEDILDQIFIQLKQTKPIREENLENLIELSNTLQNMTVCLESLNCEEYLINPQILRELVDKMPLNLRMNWGIHVKLLEKKVVSIKDFSCWLEEFTQTVGYMQLSVEKKDRKQRTILATNSAEKSRFCSFCKKSDHYHLTVCEKFKESDVAGRWKFVVDKKLCFCCLLGNHKTSLCRKRQACNINGCKSRHNSLLHNPDHISSSSNENNVSTEGTYHAKQLESKENTVLLKIVPVTLEGPKTTLETCALCDEASTITIIEEEIANILGCTGETEPLTMKWTNDTIKKENNSRRVSIRIKGKHENKQFTIRNARTVKNLQLPKQTINVRKLQENYPFMREINNMEDFLEMKPTILIGQDNWPLIIGRNVIYENWNGPALSKTRLGWIVHGNLPLKFQLDNYTLHIREIQLATDEELHNLVKESFSIENTGFYENKCDLLNEKAKTIIEKTTKRIGQKWETGLLWKDENVVLPESRCTAMKRLKQIERKMDEDEQFREMYKSKIDEYLRKGYARKLSIEESLQTSSKTWYLPHFAVYNENKPGKLRLVFDAASKSHGVSLNSCLMSGPDLFSDLICFLFKFREKRIAFAGDIREMFLRIKIIKQDRDAQRFLWRGERRDIKPEIYEMTSMIFGAASSPCSAQAVRNKNAQEFIAEFPDAVTAILTKHFMDDYLDSVDTDQEALTRIRDVMNIHLQGGFQMCNWICNSRKVLNNLPPEITFTKMKNLSEHTCLPTERILGLWWDPNEDYFKFEHSFERMLAKIPEFEKTPTKRQVLRVAMSVFDPLGFLNTVMVQVRILMQDIWRTNIQWDEKLNKILMERWQNWLELVKKLKNLKIPRSYFNFRCTTTELHVYCDASERAYAAVAYFRAENNGKIETSFITSKVKVAPLKTISIPRLELLAAVLGARLGDFIQRGHTFHIERTIYWSDSKTVILWLRSDSRNYKQFVALRVEEIREKTKNGTWRWVNTKQNIADEATKWNNPVNVQNWLTGPFFLKKPEDQWPEQHFGNEECILERRKFIALVTQESPCLPDPKNFSKYTRLMRTTAWIFRFIYNIKISSNLTQGQKRIGGLVPEEIDIAEKKMIKKIQQEDFQSEINDLKKMKKVGRESKLYQLTPFLDDDNIIRMSGRLKHAPNLDESSKNPAILHPENEFTKLLIMFYHQRNFHQGKETVVNMLREKYWILHMRNAVKKCISNCSICRNRRSKVENPQMGYLPYPRVTGYVRPFTNCGLDYFGPILVKIGKRQEKRYGVLFTCLAIRAIHIELAHSLETDSAIMAIKRMISRRGCPKHMYSDNGTNLRGTDREIRTFLEELDQEVILNELTMRGIKWHFSPATGAHFGGTWERLIRSVKLSLRVILKEAVPKEETLQTVLTEIEHSVNSRPLTWISDDPDDPECITPNNFLIGTPSGSPVLGDEVSVDLKKQWTIAQKLADNFWRRWVREYLPILNKRPKWHRDPENIKIDDLVVIVDSNNPRNYWPKGRIVSVHPGKDGRVRVVDVKTTTGLYRRPVSKLCRLT